MHLSETFAVKLLQIVVSDASPKKVLAHILLIELTKIINFSKLNYILTEEPLWIFDVKNLHYANL